MCKSNRCRNGKPNVQSSKLEKLLWVKVVTNVVYIVQHCTIKVLRSVTHEVMWSRKRPCAAHMRVLRVEKLVNSIVIQVFDYSQSGSVESGTFDISLS